MKVLFSALHLAYFRNFESVIRGLAARGHHVHLTADETEGMGGRDLAERLAAEHPTVTWDMLPSLEDEPWYDAARKLRVGLDYVRALEPRYASSPKLRLRAKGRTPRLVRWASAVPIIGAPATRATLTRVERLLPRGDAVERYLREQAPDVVVLTSLTYSRSQQLDVLKAARALRIPVAAAIMSWDHLSSKALLHMTPDMVLVWNDVQRREAVEMHGLDASRVAVTGAQCYDQWFTRTPERSREEFCRAVGLRSDRPFALWVHSALSPTPEPPEPMLVTRWIEALRSNPDPRLRELGVLVRPHPERLKEWAGISLDRYENVAFHGRNPIDADAKRDYFDSLYFSSAVIGLVTSAFLEAAIVGRPVLTFELPEYRLHQEEMLHFQYLRTVEGGLVRSAPDIESHLTQLVEAIALDGARDERNRRFLNAFIRPGGLDTPATPAFIDALERLGREGTSSDPTLEQYAWLRPIVGAAAVRGRSGVVRWLLLDERGDAWDENRLREQQAQQSRIEAKVEHQRFKLRRRARRARRDAVLRVGKEVKGALRRGRHRLAVTAYRGVAVTANRAELVAKEIKSAGRRLRYGAAVALHRALAVAGVRRGDLPEQSNED
jgi:hypothetical protein